MIDIQILVGFVGADPEIEFYENGRAKTQINLATEISYYDSSKQKVVKTEWHNDLTAYGNTAENIAKYVKTGHLLFLQCHQHTNEWMEDGIKKYKKTTVIDKFKMLNRPEKKSTVTTSHFTTSAKPNYAINNTEYATSAKPNTDYTTSAKNRPKSFGEMRDDYSIPDGGPDDDIPF